MAEENKETDTNKTSDAPDAPDASEASEVSHFDPNFFGRFQRYLFTTGVILFLTFWLLVFLPIIREDIYIEKKTIFADLSNIVGVLLIANVIFFIIVNFLDINIQSKTEQEEERVRKQVRERVREIDLRLNLLRYDVNYGVEDAHSVQNEFDNLRFERDKITGRGLHKLELLVSTNWSKTLVESHKRLLDEEGRLNARNVANLGYGVLAAVLGVFVLITAAILPYIWDNFATPAFNGIPVYYFPVTPVVIITEIVAIFFLRLHSQTEHRIERNKNEITNIELRLAAGLMLSSPTGQPDFTSLSNHLAKEERNFVLGKNESSAGVSTNSLLEILSKVIKGGTK